MTQSLDTTLVSSWVAAPRRTISLAEIPSLLPLLTLWLAAALSACATTSGSPSELSLPKDTAFVPERPEGEVTKRFTSALGLTCLRIESASGPVIALIGGMGYLYHQVLYSLVIVLPIIFIGLYDMAQNKRAVLKNFPVIGRFRYMLEAIRPEIQQYFVENDTDGKPISREFRSVVYQRAKRQMDTVPFGTMRDVYSMGYEWVNHSIAPKHVDPTTLRVMIGGPQCTQPYSSSVFNISAMSYGSLSKNAVLALNGGAKKGNFYHNTGEGSISPYHKKPGGDLVWQIGTAYFGCRSSDGKFNPEMFQERATDDQVKMIEIKISQGAKPAHGGILPAQKITPEIAEIRGVIMGKDVISPPYHSEFSTPQGLLEFVQRLRELSGGKPVGFKICVGHPHEVAAICQAIKETEILPDFISVDGGEGGTGAAPLEFSNSVGTPLDEGLVIVDDMLRGYDLREDIRVISMGKVFTAFQMLNKMALGADALSSARGMMLALGCIQARRCNSNQCPVGVATTDPNLVVGLDVPSKADRIYNYHRENVESLAELIGTTGVDCVEDIRRSFINRRINRIEVKTYEELYPTVEAGSFINGHVPLKYKRVLERVTPNSFVMSQ